MFVFWSAWDFFRLPFYYHPICNKLRRLLAGMSHFHSGLFQHRLHFATAERITWPIPISGRLIVRSFQDMFGRTTCDQHKAIANKIIIQWSLIFFHVIIMIYAMPDPTVIIEFFCIFSFVLTFPGFLLPEIYNFGYRLNGRGLQSEFYRAFRPS